MQHVRFLILAILAATPISATLLGAGDFDSATEVDSWTPDQPAATTLEWFPRDGTDNIFSGSMKVSKSQGARAILVTRCFEMPENTRSFEVGGRVAILDDQGSQQNPETEVTAFLGVNFLAADNEQDCLERANGLGVELLSGPRSWTTTRSSAFFDEVPEGVDWGFVKLGVQRNDRTEAAAIFDGLYVIPRTGDCFPFESEDVARTCYLDGRFQITADFSTLDGSISGPASAAELKSDNSAVLTFFGPNNWEILVKVLDGCAVNDRFWVFLAATTNQSFRLIVEDTLTGDQRVYEHPGGDPAPATTDTDAFDSCDV